MWYEQFEPIYNLSSEYEKVIALADKLSPILDAPSKLVSSLNASQLYVELSTKDLSALNPDEYDCVNRFLTTYLHGFTILKKFGWIHVL